MPEKGSSEKTNHDLEKQIRNKIYKFVTFLFLFLAAFIILDRMLENFVSFLCFFNAKLLSEIVHLFGVESSLHNNQVEFPGHKLIVIKECTGIYMAYVYLAAVFAYPAGMKQKGIGTALGILGIFVFNVLRLSIVGLAIMWRPEFFDLIHSYIWYVISIVFVLVLFKYWTAWVAESD